MKRNVLVLLLLFAIASLAGFAGAMLKLEQGTSALSKGLMAGAIVLYFLFILGLVWMILRKVAE